MATTSWIDGSGTWTDSTHWSDGVPGPADTAVLDGTTDYTTDLSTAATISVLHGTDGLATLDLAAGALLNVLDGGSFADVLAQSAGATLEIGGVLAFDGDARLAGRTTGNGTLAFGGLAQGQAVAGASIDIAGLTLGDTADLLLDSGAFVSTPTITVGGSATLAIGTGANLDVASLSLVDTGSVLLGSGTPGITSLTASGNAQVVVTGAPTLAGTVDLAATVDTAGGTLTLTGGSETLAGTAGGGGVILVAGTAIAAGMALQSVTGTRFGTTLDIAAGATLILAPGVAVQDTVNVDFSRDVLANAGLIQVGGVSSTIAEALDSVGSISLGGGTLTLAGGTLGGVVSGPGEIDVGTPAFLETGNIGLVQTGVVNVDTLEISDTFGTSLQEQGTVDAAVIRVDGLVNAASTADFAVGTLAIDGAGEFDVKSTLGGFATIVDAGTLIAETGAAPDNAERYDGVFLQQGGTIGVLGGTLTLSDIATLDGAVGGDNSFGEPANGTLALPNAVVVQSLEIVSATVSASSGFDLVGSLTLNSGTLDLVAGLGVAAGTVVRANGTSTLADAGALTDNGLIEVATSTLYGAGSLKLAAVVVGDGAIRVDQGNRIEFAGSVGPDLIVQLATSDTLKLDAPTQFQSPIEQLSLGDTIDLANEVVSGASIVAGSTLAIGLAGGGSLDYALIDPTAIGTLSTTTDGTNSTVIVGPVPCFAAGTRIGTPDGEVPVEALRVGQKVRTASGAAARIRWIGDRRIDCRRHPHPEQVRPIRVLAGAFGRLRPHADLLLSPDHAVALRLRGRTVLVPIRTLVNGATIRQERLDEVHYFHIELTRHDIVLANGLATESYLDTGNRVQFGGAVVPLHPDFAPRSWADACAELLLSGPAVEGARRRLSARAERLGWRLGDPARARIVAQGHDLPAQKTGCTLLPAGTQQVEIISECNVPRQGDCRSLGVCIDRVTLDGAVVPLGSPALARGFYAVESDAVRSWRWTDGHGVLAFPPQPRETVLRIDVAEALPVWRAA
ncbi:MAG: Hint domain-containing protein [Acidisphaera sp.]|nr:Hint domain-containing protein [Acidisphaera sp.]